LKIIYIRTVKTTPVMKIRILLLFVLFLSTSTYSQVCQVIITHVISGNQVQYNAFSPDSPATWSWFFNGGTPLTSNLQNPVITYATPGTYICACTVNGGPNNCSPSLSAGQDTVIISNLGLNEIKRINEINIFSQHSVPTFEIKSGGKQSVSVQLHDFSGRLVENVFTGFLNPGSNLLRMRPIGLPPGNYILNIRTEEGLITRKFLWND
jgi:hypothetical protein